MDPHRNSCENNTNFTKDIDCILTILCIIKQLSTPTPTPIPTLTPTPTTSAPSSVCVPVTVPDFSNLLPKEEEPTVDEYVQEGYEVNNNNSLICNDNISYNPIAKNDKGVCIYDKEPPNQNPTI